SIKQWLEWLGLMDYADVFQRNAVDLEVLRELTDQDLEKIGVHPLGHRKKLLKAIAELNGERPPTTTIRFASPEQYMPKHLAERILLSKNALGGRAEAGHRVVCRSQGLNGASRRPRPRGGAQDPRPRSRTNDGGGASLRGH